MSHSEKKTFFLYHDGKPLESLTLGTLILGDYANPTLVPHYPFPEPSPSELKEHAYFYEPQNKVFNSASGFEYCGGLEGARLGNANVSIASTCKINLTAKGGKRYELKDPPAFLNNHVLKKKSESRRRLRIWVTVANSEYITKLKFALKPEIWMCTGIIQLSGVKISSTENHQVHTSIGLDPSLVPVPLGSVLKINSPGNAKNEAEFEEPLVWAARFQRIKVKYLRLDEGETPELPSTVPLYKDRFSEGNLRSEREAERPNAADIELDGYDTEGGEQREKIEDGKLYEALARVTREFEDSL